MADLKTPLPTAFPSSLPKSRPKRPPAGVANAGPWSYFTFSWIYPTINLGHKGEITEDDIQDLCVHDDTRTILKKLVEEWDKELKLRPEKPKLWMVLWRVFGYYYLISSLAGFLESVCKIAEAVLLGYIIRFFQDPDVSMTSGYLYALAMSLVGLVHATMHHHLFFPGMRSGTRVRVGLIALMYRKCLTLSSSSAVSTGATVNMISNDVQPFENALPFANYIWLGPVEFVMAIYFMYANIGLSCFAGLAVFALLMPIQAWFAKQFGRLREQMVGFRDDRIRALSDVLQGIQLVKLSGWEDPMQASVGALRELELGRVLLANRLRAINEAFFFFFPSVVSAVAFITYWALGNELRPDKVFTTLALFNVIRLTMTSFFPKAVETLSECRVSVGRITRFLMLPEQQLVEYSEPTDPTHILSFHDASFAWKIPDASVLNEIVGLSQGKKTVPGEKDSVEPTRDVLKGISLNLRRDELLAVVGPVGSGKSSLCMALLRELALTNGSAAFARLKDNKGNNRALKVAYATQSPWIFAGSIRDNILFGESYDEVRFREVIKVCELERDLGLFPDAEFTLIGEKGVTLSGGQRARIALARATYSQADVYILDDPLSAVDPHVGRGLFNRCILGYLAGRPRVLVTHQLQYIKDCDSVLVLEQGEITHYGLVAEVMGKDVNGETEKKMFVEVLREFAADKEDDVASEETVLDAKVKESVDRDDGILLGEEEYNARKNEMVAEDREVGSTPLSSYWAYFRAGSSIFILICLFISMSIGQAILVMTDWYLSYWSSESAEAQRSIYNIAIFCALAAATTVTACIRAIWFFDIMLASSRNIFKRMLDAVLKTSIQFFHIQPHGRILNRFSKDQSNIDELLPYNFYDCVQMVFMIFGSVVIVCVINVYVIISLPFLVAVFYYLRRFYMLTSRQVKRIESTTRSPVYSLLSETLDGLSTIRAFTAQDRFERIFVDAQNENVRAFFAYLGSARWLGFRLDTLASLFLAISTFACIASRATQSPGLVGLSLTYVLQLLGSLQWAVRQSIEVEITFISVERMLAYTRLPSEAPRITSFRPPREWPHRAEVEFKDMSLTYPGNSAPVLKNINLHIKSFEKIGVVGRTGAGKSSLLTALFRLVESKPDGCIRIDGIPISELGTLDLRTRLSIIPQEPFLFKGTLRFNLDPFNEHDDLAIWQALEAAELKRKIEIIPEKLDAPVSENGKNFSVGERQLISLCRAILRNAKLIVMDEATANIDLASDRLIQHSIHTYFRNTTILTIAHRLNTVIGDYDRILVLEAGEVVEFGDPWELLQNEDGWLSRMVRQTGAESERDLRAVAEKKWRERKEITRAVIEKDLSDEKLGGGSVVI